MSITLHQSTYSLPFTVPQTGRYSVQFTASNAANKGYEAFKVQVAGPGLGTNALAGGHYDLSSGQARWISGPSLNLNNLRECNPDAYPNTHSAYDQYQVYYANVNYTLNLIPLNQTSTWIIDNIQFVQDRV